MKLPGWNKAHISGEVWLVLKGWILVSYLLLSYGTWLAGNEFAQIV
jgi:hypothetical protein